MSAPKRSGIAWVCTVASCRAYHGRAIVEHHGETCRFCGAPLQRIQR